MTAQHNTGEIRGGSRRGIAGPQPAASQPWPRLPCLLGALLASCGCGPGCSR
ncbi:MAG: hypothetical protein JOZ42_10430 [Acetobacteraceae bacterium]|nr:hypothetical protein [Acetobacteraceae bacterium]